MAEISLTHEQQEHVEAHAPYGTVFFILLNFTLMEYFYAKFHGQGKLFPVLMAATLALTLITLIFSKVLHLEFNRRWVYLTLIPAFILAFLGGMVPLLIGLMVLAVTKAALVGIYFMHLKFEGRWVYYMLVPAGFLAAVMIFALFPDIALHPGEEELSEEEEVAVATPAPAPSSPALVRIAAPRP
jgi:hypothetical protein